MRMKKRGIMKKGLILGLSCMMLGSTITITRAAENTKPLTDFGNVLDVTADPKEKIYGTYSTNEYNNFSDMGAWHGYYLHQKTATDLYGGFAGPVIIAEEYPINLSDSINKINLEKVTAPLMIRNPPIHSVAERKPSTPPMINKIDGSIRSC